MSSIAPELLTILRCPQCRGALRTVLTPQEALECPVCRLRYAVREGIPIMLIDAATPY